MTTSAVSLAESNASTAVGQSTPLSSAGATTSATTAAALLTCASIVCASNAQCINTSVTGYCACNSGYYGNSTAGGNCKQDTGNSQVRVLIYKGGKFNNEFLAERNLRGFFAAFFVL